MNISNQVLGADNMEEHMEKKERKKKKKDEERKRRRISRRRIYQHVDVVVIEKRPIMNIVSRIHASTRIGRSKR